MNILRTAIAVVFATTGIITICNMCCSTSQETSRDIPLSEVLQRDPLFKPHIKPKTEEEFAKYSNDLP